MAIYLLCLVTMVTITLVTMFTIGSYKHLLVLLIVVILAFVFLIQRNQTEKTVETVNNAEPVAETETQEVVPPVVKEYFISAEGSYLVGSRSFHIEGVTDLPDGAALSVTVYDEDYYTHDDADFDWRMENLTYVSENTTVRDGRFASLVEASEFEAPLKSDVYTVEVSFNPRNSSQPSNVVSVTGENGEYLSGNLVGESITGLRTLKFTNNINIKSNTKSFTEWKNPEAEAICTDHPSWKVSECEAVAERGIWIGMSYEMLVYSLGEPDSKNPSNYGNRTQWQWCWRDVTPSCFYDDDGDERVDSYN